MTRNHRTGDSGASLLGVALLVGAALLWYYWRSLERATADRTTEDGTLWFYASDVAPGDVLDGHAEIDAGLRVTIAGVVVNGAGGEQLIKGRLPGWGDRIQVEVIGGFVPKGEDRDRIAFTVRVPNDARPGDVLPLDISVEYVTAENNYLGGFKNEWHAERFRIDVPIHSRTASILRRSGKATLAVASWIGVVALLVAASRWYGRRDRTASPAWLLLLVPHAILGWFWFSTLVEHATRLHGWWVVLLCLIIWYLAFAAVFLVTARDRACRYTVVQTRLPVAEGDAYRAPGAPVPAVEVHQLEAAWRTAGFAVERRRGELRVSRFEGGSARVPIPASQTFGGGESFEITSEDADTALALMSAAAGVLGELRWTVASRGRLP